MADCAIATSPAIFITDIATKFRFLQIGHVEGIKVGSGKDETMGFKSLNRSVAAAAIGRKPEAGIGRMKGRSTLTMQTEPSHSEISTAGTVGPFLTIITRTQGRRPHTLVEVLTCLAAQTDTDFEVLLLGHRLDLDTTSLVLDLVDDFPLWLRSRIRYISVQDGTRTRPLSTGFAAARGGFIAVLDDDDIIFAHWVETFRNLSRAMPGRILRTNTVAQIVDTVSVQGMSGLRGEGPPEARYAKTFNFFDHILENRSPFMTLAFPRQLIEREGITFDETLTTTEDWDFFMRCAQTSGVVNAAEVTSVYRHWKKGDSSRTLHCIDEWQENYHCIQRKWDEGGFRLPLGSLPELACILREHADFSGELRWHKQEIIDLFQKNKKLDCDIDLASGELRWHRQEISNLLQLNAKLDHNISLMNDELRWHKQEITNLRQRNEKLDYDIALITKNRELRLVGAKTKANSILNSTSWRLSRPLRRITLMVTGGQEVDATWLHRASLEQVEELVFQLYHSTSWRLAFPIRLVARLLERLRPG